ATIEDGLHKRTLQHRILGIEGQKALGVARFGAVVPLLMDARAIAQEVAFTHDNLHVPCRETSYHAAMFHASVATEVSGIRPGAVSRRSIENVVTTRSGRANPRDRNARTKYDSPKASNGVMIHGSPTTSASHQGSRSGIRRRAERRKCHEN